MTETPSPAPSPDSSGPAANAPMVQRIMDILMRPRATWAVIETERASIAGLFIPYVLALAAIGPLAGLIGGQVFGIGAFGFSYRPGLTAALTSALLSYGLTLVGVFVLALIINALAPSFGGTRDQTQAMKVAAYSGTAGWLAAIFGLIPTLAVLGIVGLYSLYLLYLGLPRLMKAPQDKALGYTVVVIIMAAVLFFVIGAVATGLTATTTGLGRINGPSIILGGNDRGDRGRVTLPGGRAVDVDSAEAATDIVGSLGGVVAGMAGQATGGGATGSVVASSDLQALLPASLGGLSRTSIESSHVGIGSMAAAIYQRDDRRISLTVSDLGPVGAMAMMMAPESYSESNGGYERSGRVNGRFVIEKYHPSNLRGHYGVMIADRILVQAEGEGVDLGALKSAVGAVNTGRLERLARG